jgi:5-(carboxyamino)imidazole ribonucleotide synthase
MKRVGILGGGQLGSLLLESIHRLGGTTCVYDPDRSAPAARRTDCSYQGDWLDKPLLEKFFKACDVVTYEFENVEIGQLKELEQIKPIIPGVDVLKITQHRGYEKQFLAQTSLPHVDFALANSFDELVAQAEQFGYPFVLKTVRGGYDGKGQFRIDSKADLDRFKSTDRPMEMVLERLLDITMEVSCIVARSPHGQEVCFPVFENVHSEHILDLTLVPARISATQESAIKEIALAAARALNVSGLLTTEFFLSQNHIYINEFAPRPHNSGHVSMKACTLSQYDALARILLDVPLSQPNIVAPGYFCMANLLGDVWLAQGNNELDISMLARHPDVIDVVLYGKSEPRAKRKMGHFITYASSAQAAIASAKAFRSALYASEKPVSCQPPRAE